MNKQMMTDRYCHVDGIKIRYWSAGNSRKTVVLIHGLGGSVEAWTENILPLSGKFTVYAVELPGHGKSDKPEVRYTLEFFSTFIRRFVEEMKIAPCHIVGLSFGGAVSLRYVLDNPDNVDKLVLVSSVGLDVKMGKTFSIGSLAPIRRITGFVPRWLFNAYAKSTVYDSRNLPPEIVDFYFGLLKTKAFRRVLLSMQEENFDFFGSGNARIRTIADNIHKVNKKTLIIWGKNDTMIPLKFASRGNRLIQNSTLAVFDRCSHNPQYEHAEEFNKRVIEFLIKQE